MPPAAIDSSAIHGVLFDLDDTLHDRDAAFVEWATAFLRDDIGLDDQDAIADALQWIVAFDRGGEGDKRAMFAAVKQRHPSTPKSADEMLRSFFAHRTDYMRLSDGVGELFAALREGGIPWGIVTNGNTEQWDKLRRLELDTATQFIIVSSDHGHAKPHESIFLAAAQLLDVAPQAILFVGDHPANDIGGAQAVGMRTAWLRRGRAWPEELGGARPDLTLDGIGELVGWLKV